MEAFRFFQYIDNTILFIKSSNERNSSEELNIDFRENDERVFEYSFEKFEMKIGNENYNPEFNFFTKILITIN